MVRDFFRNMSPGMGLFLTVLLMVFGMLIFLMLSIVASGFYTEIWDANFLMSGDLMTPEGRGVIRILQISQTLGFFIFPALIIAMLGSEYPWKFLGFNKISGRYLLLSILLIIIAIPGINFIASINAKLNLPEWMIEFEKSAERVIKALLESKSPSIVFVNVIMIAVLPAIGEELLFRGVIQHYFCRLFRNTFWGIFVTAAIFSAIHMQFQGFVPRLLLGMIFGYLYVWTRSIWIPIAVHFVNNGLIVLIMYLIGSGNLSPSTENIGEVNALWQIGVVSIIATAVLTYTIYRERVSSE